MSGSLSTAKIAARTFGEDMASAYGLPSARYKCGSVQNICWSSMLVTVPTRTVPSSSGCLKVEKFAHARIINLSLAIIKAPTRLSSTRAVVCLAEHRKVGLLVLHLLETVDWSTEPTAILDADYSRVGRRMRRIGSSCSVFTTG